MAKVRYCTGCGNCNYGWCPIKQSNQLSGVTICNYKTPEGVKSDLSQIDLDAEKLQAKPVERYKETNIKKTAPSTENVFEKSVSSRGNNEGYVVMGKRSMFHNIQRQILAMGESQSTIDVNELKQLMVSLEQTLLIDEKVHGIQYDSMIDADIVKESKLISVHWYREVGAYKEKK